MKFIYKTFSAVIFASMLLSSCEEASDAETSGDTTNVDIFIEAEVVSGPDEVDFPFPRLFFFLGENSNNVNGVRLAPANDPELLRNANDPEDLTFQRVSPVRIANLNNVLNRNIEDDPVMNPDGSLTFDEPNLFLLYRDLTPNVERRIWDFFSGDGGFFSPRNADDEGTINFDFFDENFNIIPPDSLPSYSEPVLLLRPKETFGRDEESTIEINGRLGVFFENGDGFAERPFRISLNNI